MFYKNKISLISTYVSVCNVIRRNVNINCVGTWTHLSVLNAGIFASTKTKWGHSNPLLTFYYVIYAIAMHHASIS